MLDEIPVDELVAEAELDSVDRAGLPSRARMLLHEMQLMFIHVQELFAVHFI